MTDADTDGTVAAVLMLTAGAGPGARLEDMKPCNSHIAPGQWVIHMCMHALKLTSVPVVM